MPGGVQNRFLQVLELDESLEGRRTIVMGVVLVALMAPAWLVAPPWGIAVFAATAVVGALAGLLWSRRATASYEESIRATWTHWMRFAMACETLPEIHARVEGRSTRNRNAWHVALLVLLWALEVLLVALAFQEEVHLALAAPLLAVNGLLLGGLLGRAIHRRKWYRQLRASVADMVESGEIGVWGVL